MADSGLSIVLAEDAVLLRAGLTEVLGRFGHRVVAAVGDATALSAAVDTHRPDIVVTDVRMPPGFSDEGLRAALELRVRHPGLNVLVLSQYIATTYAFELLESGGDVATGGIGYLLKDRVSAVREFVDAIERIASGGTVIDPEVVRQLVHRERVDQTLRRLTERETEVLALMAGGRTNAAIAEALFITQAAVAKNIGSIFTKLNITDLDGNRRVLAVLEYLRGRPASRPPFR